MNTQFTFKTTRTHRPYYGAPIRRRIKLRRIHFENVLMDMRPVVSDSPMRLAA